MKYFKFSLIIVILLALNFVPMVVFDAASDSLVPCDGDGETNPCTFNSFFVLIQTVANYLVKIAAIIATIVIVIAGIWLATTGGNESRRKQAEDMLWKAVIGLIIVLAAWLIVTAIVFALTPETGTIGSRLRELFPQ